MYRQFNKLHQLHHLYLFYVVLELAMKCMEISGLLKLSMDGAILPQSCFVCLLGGALQVQYKILLLFRH